MRGNLEYITYQRVFQTAKVFACLGFNI